PLASVQARGGMMKPATRWLFGVALASASCVRPGESGSVKPGEATKPSAMDATFAALTPTKITPSDASKRIDEAIASYFQSSSTKRAYLMPDKPLYQPGESIWVRADLRATGTLAGATSGVTVQLVSPRGATVAQKRVMAQNGIAQADFELAAEIEGGEYKL